ncbi:uncharacterized protein GLRG_01728 [Colletotrichum graminicola M1.001]|uniref:Uncharacterized protein n=1 Tax=Colletotrichum graminicola (strain M1.001 / M2 / FGSC 10212) TaxID=645133 RepID=E3Q954_COLGM|nr:uncharacterized protein GLRG_01728 [Colletotrichum graminicola M1.001]EFQ27233.1 hypothetical protein GLRG_01728 [Colletotrichum graminicola M1.001]
MTWPALCDAEAWLKFADTMGALLWEPPPNSQQSCRAVTADGVRGVRANETSESPVHNPTEAKDTLDPDRQTGKHSPILVVKFVLTVLL